MLQLYSLVTSPAMATFLSYVEILSLCCYSTLLVLTVLSLTKGYYKYQMGQLAWTMAICVITVAQVTSFIENIFNGLFWCRPRPAASAPPPRSPQPAPPTSAAQPPQPRPPAPTPNASAPRARAGSSSPSRS